MDDAPIARKEPSLGCRDDVGHGRDPILKRHGFRSSMVLVLEGEHHVVEQSVRETVHKTRKPGKSP
jgi:hypothetical protein